MPVGSNRARKAEEEYLQGPADRYPKNRVVQADHKDADPDCPTAQPGQEPVRGSAGAGGVPVPEHNIAAELHPDPEKYVQ